MVGAQALGQGASPLSREFHGVGVALPDAVDTNDVHADPSPWACAPQDAGLVAAGILSGRVAAAVRLGWLEFWQRVREGA